MTEFDHPKTLDEALLIIQRLRDEIKRQDLQLESLERSTTGGSGSRAPLLNFRQLFRRGRRSANSPETSSTLEGLHNSGLFDEQYYIKQITEGCDRRKALLAPIHHYLHVGAFEGLDPSPGFDSDWYLASNPDVMSAGINPLIHYVQHGQQEGRLPFHGAKAEPTQGTPATVSGWNSKMWNGFQHGAWPELQHRVDALFDSRGAWYMAAWLFAHGDIEGALQRVEQSISLASDGATRRALVGLAKCYSLLGEHGAIRSLLDEVEYVQRLGADFPYVHANALRGPDQSQARLGALNEIFYRSGLDSVALKGSDRPLALANLAAAGSSASLSDRAAAVEKPLVSVVVPVFNAGATLPIALDSLLQQSCTALEVIVVDDGSSDNTETVARAYCERDPRIRYIANTINMGAYPSRNEGMKRARGEFVTVHDSDDWSHPQKIERQLQPLLNDAAKVASFSSWVRVLDDLTFVGPWLLNETFVEKNHSSALIRRSALDLVGYWDTVNVAADTEFLWRLEHHYGHQAIVHVLPSTPLSFALSDDSTLTRTKATHVKTIHYGLRRIYRESARWWHRQSENKPVMVDGGGRPFPIPLGISRATAREFDCMLVADFAVQGEKLHRVLKEIEERLANGERFCLFHWPDYQGWHGAAIADEVFSLCHAHNIDFAHVGISITAPVVVMLDEALWQFPPTQVVQVEALECIENGNGGLCEQQEELKAYFKDGGVDTVIDEKVV